MAQSKEAIKVVINTSTVVGSTYAQVVSVTVTDIDITLEFAFIHPRDKVKGQAVARVTLPLNVGIDLAKTIMDTMQMHAKMRKGGRSD